MKPPSHNLSAADYERLQTYFEQAAEMTASQRGEYFRQVEAEAPHLLANLKRVLQCDASPDVTIDIASPGSAPALSPRQDSARPRTIDGYEVMEELGRGGMGVVYKARQIVPDRVVALKMIRVGRFASTAEVQRFSNEVAAIAKLEHPGIVTVYEIGCHDGEHYFTMQLVEGSRFDDYLSGPDHTIEDTLQVLIDVCDAVAYCHEHGIIHRDLKPSNILLDQRGRPRLTDFGLAKHLELDSKLTRTGDVMGTPGYMAPEQADQAAACQIDARADVYSLGAILYHVLTGRPPINPADVNLAGAIQLVRDNDVLAPRLFNRRISRTLETICMKCLEANPDHRYQNAGELAAELRRYVDGEPILAQPLARSRQLHRWARQQPGLAVTWLVVGAFYLYHAICVHILRLPTITTHYDRVATTIALIWAVAAYVFQKWLANTRGGRVPLFGWATMEVALLGVLLSQGDSARSPLVVAYLVLVAASVLRFRTELVAYVTLLSLASFLCQCWWTKNSLTDTVPMAISIFGVGIIQYFALRRSHSVAMLASGKRTP